MPTKAIEVFEQALSLNEKELRIVVELLPALHFSSQQDKTTGQKVSRLTTNLKALAVADSLQSLKI